MRMKIARMRLPVGMHDRIARLGERLQAAKGRKYPAAAVMRLLILTGLDAHEEKTGDRLVETFGPLLDQEPLKRGRKPRSGGQAEG